MTQVGVIALRPPAERNPPHTVTIQAGEPAAALCGRLFSLPKELLGSASARVEEADMRRIEQAVRDVLDLENLLSDAPRRPPAPGGVANYPLWGEIYYAGETVGGERNRFIVISNDYWNRTAGSAVVVRTTTSAGRGGPGFPPIQKGQARAVCGEATTFSVKRFRLQPGSRPQPSRVTLPDMVGIARGLTETHEL